MTPDHLSPTAAEAVLTEIWCDVLQVHDIAPDDDFFALGGDSLIAVKVIGAASERGLPFTLLDLFKNPTLRSMCAGRGTGSSPAPSAELVSSADRELMPGTAEDMYPATRLQLGLIYESFASGGEYYVETVSRTVRLVLDVNALREALRIIVRRHPALRSRFDLTTFSEPMQIVQHSADLPLAIADHRGLDDVELLRRHETTMRELGRPFDPEQAPLVRVNAAVTGTSSFRLSYSFHHAIMDGWSESIFLSELVMCYAALLRGETLVLPEPAPSVEYVRLEREALRDNESRRYFEELRDHLAPVRPSTAAVEQRKVQAVLPTNLADGLTRRAAAWAVPVKSLLLVAQCFAVASVLGDPAPVVGVPVSGRLETKGADLTLGLFLNYLPVRLDLAGATWRESVRRAWVAENALLRHRRFPSSEVRSVLGRTPFEAAFNYVHFQARDELFDLGLLAPQDDVQERTDFPIRIEAINDPRANGLSFEITVDVARYEEDTPVRLRAALLTAIDGILGDPRRPIPLPSAAPERNNSA